MKLLVVGIDGADERIIRAMPMPFLHSVLDNGVVLDLHEDLWSRGWTKMVSGVDSYESGAFYSKPVLDGGYAFTQLFNSTDLIQNTHILPLWDLLEKRGRKVGFMNVPSTNPAPKVNKGFFISGAGAGMKYTSGEKIPSGVAEPEGISDVLASCGYVFDVRFKSSGIRVLKVFFEALRSMADRRVEAMLKLSKGHDVDFGFVAFMALCRMQYMFMRTISRLMQERQNAVSELEKEIVGFYQYFDQLMGRLLECIGPDHFIFVSDHGQEIYKTRINLNAWLEKKGYQTAYTDKQKTRRLLAKNSIKRVAQSCLPDSLRCRFFKNKFELVEFPICKHINYQESFMFSARYVPGIYINDDRFGGKPYSASDEKVMRVIEMFNKDPQCQAARLKARIYRAHHSSSPQQALLPDIWIDNPDSVFFVEKGEFISPNPAIEHDVASLWQVNRDMYQGIKGSKPLALHDASLSDYNADLPNDLTAIYHLIERVFS